MNSGHSSADVTRPAAAVSSTISVVVVVVSCSRSLTARYECK